ncbi:MAG: hypothetical protein QNJ02_15920 [Desulfobacterales bacterium]|nr:hypothetical protein [Desulfobacterales bacterium]
MPDSIWIITPGAYTDFDVAALGIKARPKRVMEYGLSDIGRYLLQPGSIEVENQLVGCECDLVSTNSRRVRQALGRLFKGRPPNRDTAALNKKTFLARNVVKIPSLKDRQLAGHVEHLRGMLQPLDPVLQEIADLNLAQLADIRGVCQDEAGHRTLLTLKGSLTEKHQYVRDHLLKPVRTTLASVHIADGLFEMRGWRSGLFTAKRRHRLLRFHVDGKFFACLLNAKDRMAFWINDLKNLHRMVLLQQAVDTSPPLAAAFNQCLADEARPMRLMFNPNLDIDYTRSRIPQVYKDLFSSLDLDIEVQRNVIRSLNHHQLGVSFSYVTQEGFGDPLPITNISVMHDLKALEPLRTGAPQVFAAINQRVTVSEAGKYYLLENIRGRSDESEP